MCWLFSSETTQQTQPKVMLMRTKEMSSFTDNDISVRCDCTEVVTYAVAEADQWLQHEMTETKKWSQNQTTGDKWQ